MAHLRGTGALIRLALRLDRVRLAVWVVVIGTMPAATAANYQKLYPTAESLSVVRGVLDTPALVALGGPLFGLSIGGLTAWKIGVTAFILAGLMNILTVLRHTRAEEEAGRLELVGATVVGRYAPLAAALVTVAVADAAVVLVTTLGLTGVGLAAAGSLALGLSIGATGLAFAGVAAVCAQLTTGARAASGMAMAVLGAAYLLRAVGDTGPTGLSWISPMGWAIQVRPYAGERWWVLGLLGLLAVVGAGTAFGLVARRDLGTGLFAERAAAPVAGRTLTGPLGLAWRMHRGVLLGWLVAMALAGAAMGGAVRGIGNANGISQQMLDVLARMGGRKALVDQFLAATAGIAGLTVAAYTVQTTLRLRAEESAGRLEPLLAARAGRIRWAASHLAFALLGTAAILAVFGAAEGLTYGVAAHDVTGQVGRIVGAALVQLPAAWVLAGLGVTLFGLSPRLAALTWAALVTCVILVELGAILGLSHWVLDVTPFAHVPKLPGATLAGLPLAALTAVSAALVAAGLAGFHRRDLAA